MADEHRYRPGMWNVSIAATRAAGVVDEPDTFLLRLVVRLPAQGSARDMAVAITGTLQRLTRATDLELSELEPPPSSAELARRVLEVATIEGENAAAELESLAVDLARTVLGSAELEN